MYRMTAKFIFSSSWNKVHSEAVIVLVGSSTKWFKCHNIATNNSSALWLSTSYFIRKYLLCVFVGPWILECITRLSSCIGYDFVVVVMLPLQVLLCFSVLISKFPPQVRSCWFYIMIILCCCRCSSERWWCWQIYSKFSPLQSGKSVNKLFTMNAVSLQLDTTVLANW